MVINCMVMVISKYENIVIVFQNNNYINAYTCVYK